MAERRLTSELQRTTRLRLSHHHRDPSMSNNLRRLVESGAGPVRWIEPNGYATRAYAGGNPGWFATAQSAAATLAQANSALRSQVLSIDVAQALFAQTDEPGSDALDHLEDVLGNDGNRQRAVAVARAVEQTLGGRVELMLQLPSPAAQLRRAGAQTFGFDELDDVAAALTGVIRAFSEVKVAGLLLATDVDEAEGEDEMEVLGPIMSMAAHYRWLTALRIDGDLPPSRAAAAGFNVILLPNYLPADFAGDWTVGNARLGGGLAPAFWSGEGEVGDDPDALYYGDAPGAIAPESILARVAQLATD